LILAALLLAAFAVRTLMEIRAQSATYDEPYLISFGYATLKTGDFRLRKDKSVLSGYLVGAPLLGSGAAFTRDEPQWRDADAARWGTGRPWRPPWGFSLRYLYKNRIPADSILLRARLAPLAAALLLGVLVFLMARRLHGDLAGLCALAFFTLCPNMIAHAGLATEDMFLAASLFAAVFALTRLIEEPGPGAGLAFGAALAASLLSKNAGLIALPVCAALVLAAGGWRGSWWRDKARPFLAGLAALVAAFLIVFRFAHVGEYFDGLALTWGSMQNSQMAFFHGRYGAEGFWYYHLAAFLVKTSLPVLALSMAALLRREGFWDLRRLALLVPVLAIMTAASLVPLQTGHRHLLPIYPFLFVAAGSLAVLPLWRWALCLALPWLAVDSALVHPHYLAYFNQLAGGPAGGWRYMVDASMDWGQDLKGLRRYVEQRGASDVVLSYYGSGLPEAVGFPFQDLFSFGLYGEKNHLNSPEPKRELLAVSVTNLQGVYLTHVLGEGGMTWLKEREPEARIGHTIFVYDITDDAAAHEWLAHTYAVAGMAPAARREIGRALALDPQSPWPLLVEALLCLQEGEPSQGLQAFAAAAHGGLQQVPWRQAVNSSASREFYSVGLTGLSSRMLSRGQPALAGLGCRFAVAIDPECAAAFVVLSGALARQGFAPAAREAAVRAAQLKAQGYSLSRVL
jgi:4-amino-4-deoxy-L-arabinose transferase-like glycosyltransferase